VLLVDVLVVLDTGPVVSVVEVVLVDVASVVLDVVDDALVVPSVIPLVPVPSVVVDVATFVVVGVLVDVGSVVGPSVVLSPVVAVPDAELSPVSSPHAVSATAADSTPM
jgi:hypothetical protein